MSRLSGGSVRLQATRPPPPVPGGSPASRASHSASNPTTPTTEKPPPSCRPGPKRGQSLKRIGSLVKKSFTGIGSTDSSSQVTQQQSSASTPSRPGAPRPRPAPPSRPAPPPSRPAPTKVAPNIQKSLSIDPCQVGVQKAPPLVRSSTDTELKKVPPARPDAPLFNPSEVKNQSWIPDFSTPESSKHPPAGPAPVSPVKTTRTPGNPVFTAACDYAAQSDVELSMTKDDAIMLLEEEANEDGWVLGMGEGGEEGYVPISFLRD